MGFIAPVVLVGKTSATQDICHTNNWDEPVDDATSSRWERWRNELFLLENLKVPRGFKPTKFGKVVSAQLHCMSDASTCGYGQCSYLRLEDENGKVNVSFVMGKARVAPKKTVSIPRLELAAATISVKIRDVVKNELEYENIEDHYWTDSKVVLGFKSFPCVRGQQSSAHSRLHQPIAVALCRQYIEYCGRRFQGYVTQRLRGEIKVDQGS